MQLTPTHHFFKIFKKPIFIPFHNPLILTYLILIIVILMIFSQSHVLADKKIMPNRDFPTHFNFLKGRKRVTWCGHDPDLCSDPGRNPWGGSTCCFHRYCKDVRNDPNHCGSCGRVCGFGRVCCGGSCVDTRIDPLHCGACFEVCPRVGDSSNRCSYSMCDYGG